MRCSKCGFISFDHMDTCLKCTKSMVDAFPGLQGTTYNAISPHFLSVYQDQEEEQDAGDGYGEIGVAEPDLNTMLDDGDEDVDMFDEEISLEDEDDLEEPLLESDDELAMDLGQFEDELEEEPETSDIDLDESEEMFGNGLDSLDDEISLDDDFASEDEEADIPAIDIPEELNDITDLASPADEQVGLGSIDEVEEGISLTMDQEEEVPGDMLTQEQESGDDAGDGLNDLDFADLDLDMDDDDSSLSLDEDISEDNLSDLSLSEIDLSDTVSSGESSSKDEKDSSESDPELDFDLDLFGIDLSDE